MPEDIITSKDIALMAILEEYFRNEKALEEERKKKLKEFAKELEEAHSGWVDIEIFEETVPLRLSTTNNEVTSEQMQPNRSAEMRPALFWIYASIPAEARGTTESFKDHATKEFIDTFNSSIAGIFSECKGEIVYYSIEHGKVHGIIVFKPKDVDTEEKKKQAKSQINESLNQAFNIEDGKWEVALIPVEEWGDVSVTLVQKRNEMNTPKSFR